MQRPCGVVLLMNYYLGHLAPNRGQGVFSELRGQPGLHSETLFKVVVAVAVVVVIVIICSDT